MAEQIKIDELPDKYFVRERPGLMRWKHVPASKEGVAAPITVMESPSGARFYAVLQQEIIIERTVAPAHLNWIEDRREWRDLEVAPWD